ncbi:MAG: hypothetical protein FD167_661 [bacterium]|nr:MAG: hypothetical protein FD167_661 [bacterium]
MKLVLGSRFSRLWLTFLCICFLFLMPTLAKADGDATKISKTIVLPPEKAQPAKIVWFESAPVIDGKFDDVWKSGATFKDFYQRRPAENIAPSKPTEVFMGYDAKHLYIAFYAYDEPDKVRSTIAKRDNVFSDDYVGVILDTFNDERKAYEFFFNPVGVQADAILTEGAGEDFSVDVVMESKGGLVDNGYLVEVSIPFKSLRYHAGKDKPWGIQLLRGIQRFNEEQDSWTPISRDRSDFLAQSGKVVGFENISTEKTLEIIPTMTFSETGKRVPTVNGVGRFVNSAPEFEPGINLKLSLSSNLTFDATIKPDFAQVEADSTVIRANQRFPIFFPEKRPFFLEGIDIFQTPIRIINTRTIVEPDYAAKLTGKQGKNTFGILLASDNAPGNFSKEERDDLELRPQITKFLDKNAYVGILRLKRDIGQGSSFGFLGTTRSFIERHNSTFGFDGKARLNPKTIISFQLTGTTSRGFFFDPEQNTSFYRTGNGLAYFINLDYTGRNFGYFVESFGRTKDFRADVGFTRRINTNETNGFIRFSSSPKAKGLILSKRFVNFSQITYDFQGRSQGVFNSMELRLNLARSSFFGADFQMGYERLLEEEFGAKRTATQAGAFLRGPERSTGFRQFNTFFETTPSKKYFLFGEINYSNAAFDLDFGAGPRFPRVSKNALIDPSVALDPGTGRALTINASASYQPTDALRLSLNYTKSRLTRKDTNRVAFDDNIFSFRSTYQFTRFISFRSRIDYDTLATNVRGQLLLGWTPNPGTSLFVGYNDDLNYKGFSPFTGQSEPGFRRNGRTFFIKMSYLIRVGF